MNDQNNNASASEIPVPPGGGSWTWDGAKWISNDPVPEVQPEAASDQATTNTFEQEP